uniref:Uncharacterized protein n=1 Tax=Peronospora matthiolae TaxID=2874970 RepID=A0AAV1VE03_9STRA
MSSPTPGTLATLPDFGIGHDDDFVPGVSPHGTGGSLAHRAASVEVGVALLIAVPRVVQQGCVIDKVTSTTAAEDPVVILVVAKRHRQTLSCVLCDARAVATCSFAGS